MPITSIIMFVARAVIFAAAVSAIWVLIMFLLKKKQGMLTILLVAYLAALIQITVIRDYSGFFNLADNEYSLQSVVIMPFYTTLNALSLGAWQFLYHLIGNTIWFVPLGMYFAIKRYGIKRLIICSAALSLSIELLQFAFYSGVSDIDDVLVNTFGAVAGFVTTSAILRWRNNNVRQD